MPEGVDSQYNVPMPELPEVETITRELAGRVVGWRVSEIHLSRPDMLHGHATPLCCALKDCRIVSVSREGKWVRVGFDGGTRLGVHLGMSGRLILCHGGEPLEAHTHLRLGFHEQFDELRFIDPRRFGGLWLTMSNGDATSEWIGQRPSALGVDAMVVTPVMFQRLLKRSRQIKALLLDQTMIAGLGNIYCDEILHRAGIHPLTPASRLEHTQVKRLHQQMRRVLKAAIHAGGSTIRDYRSASNTSGGYQRRHRVYQRAGKPCLKCRTPIEHLIAAGRSTFFCPACQPLNGTSEQ